ncbi:uncharacterized protein MP3633_3181 [Marinomonas primoryensis]|uniref:Uncharacterized protein n=1 Tax=Marinomonas primoryensis TaxID=178399 RepID=A0A859CZ84_9GAMM|nr:uncharacterized protein MP3633_3181 [Marinomonas primoryensis]
MVTFWSQDKKEAILVTKSEGHLRLLEECYLKYSISTKKKEMGYSGKS